jgi:hypothetical protein
MTFLRNPNMRGRRVHAGRERLMGQEERSTISEPERCQCSFAYSGLACFKDRDVGLAISPKCEPHNGCRYPLNWLRRSPHFSCCRPLTTSRREVRIGELTTGQPPTDPGDRPVIAADKSQR